MSQSYRRLLCIPLIVFFTAGSAFAQLGLNIRILGRFGTTMEEPSMHDLKYPDTYAEFQKVNTSNYGGGIQLVTKHRMLRLGIDLGVHHLFESKVTGTEYDDKVDDDVAFEWTDADLAVNAGAFLEIAPRSWIIFQAGLGVYQIQEHYTDIEEGETRDDIKGWVSTAGFMAAAGLNIPITTRISIPILIRTDVIYRFGILMPVHVNGGVEIKL